MKNSRHLLIAPTLLAAAVAFGAEKKNEAGQPTQTFRKDIVQVGRWIHPGTGESVDIDQSRIQHWADTGNTMLAAGIKIPIPATHTNDPDANRGYVQKFEVQGDKLFMNCELIGKDAIQLAARCEVSISVVPEVKGADGKTYSDAINHVAMVTDPVIPGQGQFQIIELSRAKALQLAIGASSMDALKAIAALLGITVADNMNEAALADAIKSAIGTLKGGDMAKTQAALSKAQTDLSAAQEQVKALTLSAKRPELDPDTRDILAENHTLKLSKLVDSEQISPAVRDKLVANFGLKSDKVAAVTLSKTAGVAAGLQDAALTLVLDALGEMPKPDKSRGTVKLSREGKSDTKENAKKILESRGKKSK